VLRRVWNSGVITGWNQNIGVVDWNIGVETGLEQWCRDGIEQWCYYGLKPEYWCCDEL
jgi:hypothetical protein